MAVNQLLNWSDGRRTKLGSWPLVPKIWLGIVSAGFLVAAYRVDKGKKYGYWSQRLRLAPLALLAALIYVVGMLVLDALHLVTLGGE
jgi:hypothetical protein